MYFYRGLLLLYINISTFCCCFAGGNYCKQILFKKTQAENCIHRRITPVGYNFKFANNNMELFVLLTNTQKLFFFFLLVL
ncbi:MAG: hypothetical protein RIS47_1694 [Bacteroidota bacterium]|jgi:hypothetical protein